MDMEAWRAVVHEVAESDTIEQLNWTELNSPWGPPAFLSTCLGIDSLNMISIFLNLWGLICDQM